jgi:hypothetical protein
MKRAATGLLLLLLAGAAVWWGWRRFGAKPPVDLAKHDGQTIDFSTGRPVVKDSPADQAALEKATREMAEAAKGVTFDAPIRQPGPSPVPPKK